MQRTRNRAGQFLPENESARFEAFCAPQENGCILWTGARWGEYGRFRKKQAHVYSYERKHGPVSKRNDVHHKCETKLCVNDEHLEAKTRRAHLHEEHPENPTIQNALKTECVNGHTFDAANTFIKNGFRQCLACRRERSREAAARIRASGALCACGTGRRVWAKGVCLACYKRDRKRKAVA